jgi:D-arabinose 1-dehydrogenase-like Zn-dependent alcohol dehydrogenase
METIGQATWSHSVKSLKPGGKIIVAGATTGASPPAELNRVFFLQLSVIGSTMGTRDELGRLIQFCVDRGVRPVIQNTLALADARRGFESLLGGEVFGKIVFTV